MRDAWNALITNGMGVQMAREQRHPVVLAGGRQVGLP